MEMETVIYTDKGKAPLPEGWKLLDAISVLQKAGHLIVSVSESGRQWSDARIKEVSHGKKKEGEEAA